MGRRKNGILYMALCGTLLLSGCGENKPQETDGLVLPSYSAAPSGSGQEEALGFALPCHPAGGFHPIKGTNRLNLTLAPLLYRGLFSIDRNFEAKNDLCESYTVSGDGLTWTFWLASAEFSDGSPLTAKEVARTLNDARMEGRYTGRLENIKTVGTEGETVVVTLGEARGELPLLLDIPIIKESEDAQRPLGTGPYFLSEEETGLALIARPEAEVPLEKIPLRAVGAGDDLVYAFDAREISLVDADLTGANVLGYSGRLETTDYPTSTLLYIGCNLRSGVCQEQRVRQAAALAFDRDKMASRTLAGHGVASPLPVHPYAPGYDRNLADQWRRDLDRAAAILAEDGWVLDEEGKLNRRGQRLELRLVVNQDNTFKEALAAEAAAALEELGCVVTLDKLAWEEFMAVLERGEFDLYLGETALTADFDLSALLGRTGALNYGGFEDAETWTLMEKCRAARGEERVTTLVNLCGRTAELSPIIPLCFKNGSLLTQWGQVSGASPTQRDVFSGIENWRVLRS